MQILDIIIDPGGLPCQPRSRPAVYIAFTPVSPWSRSGRTNFLRLIDTGGYEKKDRLTRRIEVWSKADIDAELKQWLKKAYEMDT
jgi:Domain of unknown function (DUF5655)